jgi:hypothetical protein
MVEYIKDPFLKEGSFFSYEFLGRGSHRGNVHITAYHSLGDPLGRRNAKDPCGILGKGDLPGFVKDKIEGIHRFGGMDLIVIPEVFFFPFPSLLTKNVIRRIHLFPTFQFLRVLNL